MKNKRFNVGDLVKPGLKQKLSWSDSQTYITLDSDSIYQITDSFINRSTGWQSVKLKMFKPSSKFTYSKHGGGSRWYAANNMIPYTQKAPMTTEEFSFNFPKKKENLASIILGKPDDKVSSFPLTKNQTSEEDKRESPSQIVIDLSFPKTIAFMSSSNESKSSVNDFVAEQLKKYPTKRFAVYTLEKIGSVSDIKVHWDQ
jgi:hypothetical protein